MPQQKYEILRNIFCVAASRGKDKIIFVDHDEAMLSEQSLSTPGKTNLKFNHMQISGMFDFKYKEDLEECYSLLEIKRVNRDDNSEIKIENHEDLIDLAPCIGIYQEAVFFEKYNIDREFELLQMIQRDKKIDASRYKTLDKKILYLTSLETSQKRYVTQVTGSETGGMTKELMEMDKPFFDDLVLAIKPKIIICLGQLTYEMVSGQKANGFCKQLKEGKPFVAPFPLKRDVMVYGIAHCGSRGRQNVGGIENMQKAWDYIAREYYKIIKSRPDSNEVIEKPFAIKKTDGTAVAFENGKDGQVLITRSNRPGETVIMSADMICRCLGI